MRTRSSFDEPTDDVLLSRGSWFESSHGAPLVAVRTVNLWIAVV